MSGAKWWEDYRKNNNINMNGKPAGKTTAGASDDIGGADWWKNFRENTEINMKTQVEQKKTHYTVHVDTEADGVSGSVRLGVPSRREDTEKYPNSKTVKLTFDNGGGYSDVASKYNNVIGSMENLQNEMSPLYSHGTRIEPTKAKKYKTQAEQAYTELSALQLYINSNPDKFSKTERESMLDYISKGMDATKNVITAVDFFIGAGMITNPITGDTMPNLYNPLVYTTDINGDGVTDSYGDIEAVHFPNAQKKYESEIKQAVTEYQEEYKKYYDEYQTGEKTAADAEYDEVVKRKTYEHAVSVYTSLHADNPEYKDIETVEAREYYARSKKEYEDALKRQEWFEFFETEKNRNSKDWNEKVTSGQKIFNAAQEAKEEDFQNDGESSLIIALSDEGTIEGQSAISGALNRVEARHPAAKDNIESLTDDERDMYYYLLADDPTCEKANRYYKQLMKQKSAQTVSEIEEWAGKNTGTRILATAAARVILPFVPGAIDVGIAEDRDYTTVNLVDIRHALDSGVANGLVDKGLFNTGFLKGTVDEDIPVFGGWNLGNASQLVASMLDSTVALVLGGGGTIFLGADAGYSAYKEQLNNGIDEKSAAIYGIAAGVAEAVFEKVSLENLTSQKLSKYFFLEMLKQGGIEASEEVCTTIANVLSQKLILNNNSDYNRAVRQYLEAGYSTDEAGEKALTDAVYGIINDAIGGFASGAIMTGGHYAIKSIVEYKDNNEVKKLKAENNGYLYFNKYQQGRQGSMNIQMNAYDKIFMSGNVGQMLNAGMSVSEIEEAVRTYNEIKAEYDKIKSGMHQTSYNARNGVPLNSRIAEAQAETQMREEAPQQTETAGVTAQRQRAEVKTADAEAMIRAASPELGGVDSRTFIPEKAAEDAQTVFELYSNLKESGVMRADMEAAASMVKIATTAMTNVQNAQALGMMKVEDGGIYETTLRDCIDGAKGYLTQGSNAPVQSSNTMEMPEQESAPANNNIGGNENERTETGTKGMRNNEGRQDTLDSGEQTFGVGESRPQRTADTEGAGNLNEDERKNLRKQRLNRKIERFDEVTAYKNASEVFQSERYDGNIAEIPEKLYTVGMKAAVKKLAEDGIRVRYFKGTLMSETANGRFRRTPGLFIDGTNEVWASVSSERFEPEQLALHEYYHALISIGKANVEDIVQEIRERFDPDEFERIAEQYLKDYRGAYEGDRIEDIYEEILADAYAGMNRFATEESAVQYQDVVRDQTQRGTDENERATRDTRGAPESKYSIERLYNGNAYVKADRQVIFGNDPESWSEQLEDYINGKIRRGENVNLIADDGDVLTLTARTAGKVSFMYDNRGRTLDEADYERKINAGAHIDELAIVSKRGERMTQDINGRHGKDAEGGWNYRTAFFMDFDKKYYKVKLSVQIGTDGNAVYNIGDMQERRPPMPNGSSANGSAHAGESSFDESIARQEPVVKQKLSFDDEDFEADIEEWNKAGRPDGESFILGSTGEVLQGLGAIESDIYMQGDKIQTILQEHPEMTMEEIKKIPQILEDPVLILKSRNVGRENRANTRLVIFGSVKTKDGKPVLAVLDLRPVEKNLVIDDMQKVTSAYTKDSGVRFVQSSDVIYADKKRTAKLLRTIGFQMPIELQQSGYIGSISYHLQNVNISGEKFSDVVRVSDKGRYSIEEDVAELDEAYRREMDSEPMPHRTAEDLKREIRDTIERRNTQEQEPTATVTLQVPQSEFYPEGTTVTHTYGRGKPFYSKTTNLNPKEAVAYLQAATGMKWHVEPMRKGLWKAVMTTEKLDTVFSPPGYAKAVKEIRAANKNEAIPTAKEFAEQKLADGWRDLNAPTAATVHTEGIQKSDFTASRALNKIGVKIDGSVTDYSITQNMRSAEEARRNIEKQIRKTERFWDATQAEKTTAINIANGDLSYFDISERCRFRVVSELAALHMDERMAGNNLVQQRRYAIRDALLEKAMDMFPNSEKIEKNPKLFNPSALLTMNYRTPQRNMLKIFGDELGTELYEYYFAPVTRNEASRQRWMNEQFDKVRKFKGADGKERKLTKAESAYVHELLDLEGYVQKVNESNKKDAIIEAGKQLENPKNSGKEEIVDLSMKYDLNTEETTWMVKYAQWTAMQEGYSGKVDKERCKAAAAVYRQLFDDYFEAINDFLVAHGAIPINKIEGYTPHMTSNDKVNLLSKALEELGFNANATRLPAEIAGRTEEFKPNKRWTPFFEHRRGDKTDYDIVEGFESYVTYISDVLFHMDDIQKIRSAEQYLRQGVSGTFETSIQEAIDMSRSGNMEDRIDYLRKLGRIRDAAYGDFSKEEINEAYDKLIKEMIGERKKNTRYSDMVVWLENYANVLAGKQYGGDRGVEHEGGRNLLTIGNKINAVFARANVSGNLSSMLNQTAQLPAVFSERRTTSIAQAIGEFSTRKLREFAMESDFLTLKKGVSYITRSVGEMTLEGLFLPMEFMDSMMSTLAVRSAYLDALKDGMSHEAAMRFADNYGQKVMADRSKGAKPLTFYNKGWLKQAIRMFQIEALNSWEHISQDLPRDFRQIARDGGKAKAARALALTIIKYLLAAFVLNRWSEEEYGGTPAPFDVFGMTANFIASGNGLTTNEWLKRTINKVTGVELFEESDYDTFEEFDWGAAVKDTTWNLSNEIPFVSNLSGILGIGDRTLPTLDVYGIIKDIVDAYNNDGIFSEEMGLAILDAVCQLAPGGRQLSKTFSGIRAAIEGGKMNGTGENEKLQFATKDGFLNAVKMALFGVNSTNEAQAHYASGESALTEKQTKMWKEMVNEGADGIELFDAIVNCRMIQGEEISNTEKKRKCRDVILKTSLSGQQKISLYDSFFNLSDKRFSMCQSIVGQGANGDELLELIVELDAVEDNEDITASERNRNRRDLIQNSSFTDMQKLYIYEITFDDTNGSRFEEMMEMEMEWNSVMEVFNKYKELYDNETLSATEQALQFTYWVDKSDLSQKQKQYVKENFKYWEIIPANTEGYTKYTDAGLSPDNAKDIFEREKKNAGDEDITLENKINAIIQQNLSDGDTYKALEAVVSESLYNKLTEAKSVGISCKTYIDYWLKTKDVDGKNATGETVSGLKKKSICDIINNIEGLTVEQKDFLYLLEGYAKSGLRKTPWH